MENIIKHLTSKNIPMTTRLIIINLFMFIPSVLFHGMFASSFTNTITKVQIWRLLTAMFSHSGLMHLVFNMFALYMIGHVVEHMLDDENRYIKYYFVCGIGSGLISILLQHHVAVVGASGAIYGLLGVELSMTKAPTKVVIRNLLIMLIVGLSGGIDLIGHLSGFAIGMVLYFIDNK